MREVEAKTGIIRHFAACFTDHRDPERIEHAVGELLAQRIFALALGYEDLNDHDALRHDPLLAVLVGKADPGGQDRRCSRDRGKSLAGKSTLNRLELTPVGADAKSRYKKVVARHHDLESFFVETFLALHRQPPKEIVLDLDATETIDSTGLATLLNVQDGLRDKGGESKIATTNSTNRKILEITRLDQQIEVFDSVVVAVKSFY